MVEWPSITCKLHVIETSIRNSNTSNTPPQLQNPHCSEYILRWAIADEQRLPFFDHNVSHSKELAGSVAWELCRINFQQMVSLLMIPTSSLWHFKIVLTNFQACIFSSQIQSSVQRRIVSKLSCSILNFRSSTASFHNFSRELNREQYSPNYSHAQRQLLWDIADRTPLAVEHALKPVLIRKLRDRDSGQTPPPKKTVLIHRSHPTRPILSSSELTIMPDDPMISRISTTIILIPYIQKQFNIRTLTANHLPYVQVSDPMASLFLVASVDSFHHHRCYQSLSNILSLATSSASLPSDLATS